MNSTGFNENNCFIQLIESISPTLENESNILTHSRYYNNCNFKNMLQQTHNKITILNLNCQSLSAKFDNLKLFLADIATHSKITCITLQETWFDENTPLDSYCIPGYTLISKPHRITSHGGVAICLNNKFSYRKPELNHDSNVYENLTIEIWHDDFARSKYLISSISTDHQHIQ